MSAVWAIPGARWLATKANLYLDLVPPPPKEADEPKRRVLLVHAHPRPDSFSSALADAVEQGAREGGHEIRRRSLYAEKFRPELTEAERGAYFDAKAGASRLSADVRSHLADLRWADSLVLVYPTWWFNLPAMLKGYFDRTLAPGADCAWDFPGGDKALVASNGLVPKLTNIKRVMGVSTYGAPRSIALLAGDNGRNCIATAIRPNFHPDCTCTWMGLYRLDECGRQERERFAEAVKVCVRDEF